MIFFQVSASLKISEVLMFQNSFPRKLHQKKKKTKLIDLPLPRQLQHLVSPSWLMERVAPRKHEKVIFLSYFHPFYVL